jgi:hypothetical protein
MGSIAMVLVGFMSGLMAMAIVTIYKWAIKRWNNGF